MDYRPKEYQQINQMLVGYSETAGSKVEALLMLYFFGEKFTEELLYEVRGILTTVLRLVHSLVDIISSLGYLKPIIMTMQLCQMVVQGMWITDSTLIQIMDKKTVMLLEEMTNVRTITDFMNMEDDER